MCIRDRSRLKPNMGVPHFPVDFRAGHQSRDGVHNSHIDGAAPHQGFKNFKGLLTCIRLGYNQVIDIHTEGFCVYGIERMFGIDKGLSLIHI